MIKNKNKRQLKMVEEFLCPGCTLGCDTKCGRFRLIEETNPFNNSTTFYCGSHSAGTFILGRGKVYLGLPKGFNRSGENNMDVRLYLKEEPPHWNHLNVPVWAMKDKKGFVFTRVFSPRINLTRVEVWENGSVPSAAINVANFYDDID